MRNSNERGIALITTLLIMMLISALLVGFTIVVSTDQRFRFIDRDRQQAFYGASAGLEKLTADLGNLFMVNLAPTPTQVSNLALVPPVIPGISFTKQDLSAGYTITSALPAYAQISSGAYAGLIALTTVYTVDVTARTTPNGGEVHLRRDTETVAIPVFQFGMFSDVDLAFFAGSDFNFGGRVHTNGNLFLASGATLWLTDKVTAVKDVIRDRLENGGLITAAPAHTGNVSVASTNPARDLASTEGSGSGCFPWNPTTCVSTPIGTWDALSRGATNYNYWIRNGLTGAKKLDLPLLTAGGTNPDLIRRPVANENTNNVILYGERDYTKTSLRILLSDTAAQITSLPGIVGTPLSLETAAGWPGYVVDASSHPPVAATAATLTQNNWSNGQRTISVTSTANFSLATGVPLWLNNVAVICTVKDATRFQNCDRVSGGIGSGVQANLAGANWPITNNPLTPNNAATSLLGGFILIEKQDAATPSVWTDVTPEILKLGITADNQTGNTACNPNPDSVIQIQRRAVQTGLLGAGCPGGVGTQSTAAADYWSQALFDPREAEVRDNITPASPLLGGVMYYVSIDAANLKRWFHGDIPAAGATGAIAHNSNGAGYSVYFSDRRNNNSLQDGSGVDTGNYGWEDIINPGTAAGTPNGVLDQGEDVDGTKDVANNPVLDVYGQWPHNTGNLFTGWSLPLDGNARPWTPITGVQAQSNRAILFRRALKLVNGAIVGGVNNICNVATPGLTIVSENPVYIQGDWNAAASATNGFVEPNCATSVLADAVTLLSNTWNDDQSFSRPYGTSLGVRQRPLDSWYRVAIVGGKNMAFQLPTFTGPAPNSDFGTDGGAHNFLRMLEDNPPGGSTVHYLGSIATFFYSRQATGVYKSSNDIYGVPTRDFTFDTDFLDPAKLPPLTPVFRDLNTIGFWQDTRPGK